MYIYSNRDTFWQWDTNQKISSRDLKVGDILHFYNAKQPNALPLKAYEFEGKVVVDVPNILLQNAIPVQLYRWVDDGTETYTIEEFSFEVKQRPRPGDYVYTETDVLSYATLDERINQLEADGIAKIVADYLNKNPIDTGSKLTIGVVELIADKWVGDKSPYSQVVEVNGATPYSQVDLTPSVEQLAIFHDKDLAFVTENEDGVVTVYAIGDKPSNDYTMQVTIKEVSV